MVVLRDGQASKEDVHSRAGRPRDRTADLSAMSTHERARDVNAKRDNADASSIPREAAAFCAHRIRPGQARTAVSRTAQPSTTGIGRGIAWTATVRRYCARRYGVTRGPCGP
jgi:hypothetical protein